MHACDGPDGWGWVSRALHWAMAVLIVFQLGFGLYMTRVPDLIARFALTQTHKSWGALVFVLAVLRVGWRIANPARPPLPPMPAWQVRAARASHGLLYAFMFLMPVSGWLLASASPVQDLLRMQNLVFGTVALPDPFVPGSARLEAGFGLVHRAAGVGLALVLALHAAAAVWHQVVMGDGLLARMLWRR